MKIRKAKLKDAPLIRKLDKFRQQLNKYGPIDRLNSEYNPIGRGYNETFIVGKKKWCLVAEEDGKILGFITFLIKKRLPHFIVRRLGYLDLLYVDSKQRGKGVGVKLFNAAKEILKKEGMKYFEASVHPQNPALKFWEKQGFKQYRKEMYVKI